MRKGSHWCHCSILLTSLFSLTLSHTWAPPHGHPWALAGKTDTEKCEQATVFYTHSGWINNLSISITGWEDRATVQFTYNDVYAASIQRSVQIKAFMPFTEKTDVKKCDQAADQWVSKQSWKRLLKYQPLTWRERGLVYIYIYSIIQCNILEDEKPMLHIIGNLWLGYEELNSDIIQKMTPFSVFTWPYTGSGW